MDLVTPLVLVAVPPAMLLGGGVVAGVLWLFESEPEPETPVKMSTLIAIWYAVPEAARRCLCRQDRQPADPHAAKQPTARLRWAYARSRN